MVLAQPSRAGLVDMQIFRGLPPRGRTSACALTIGNFDGVHRGHQAMLALLKTEARQRDLPACVLTFEPHPREFFASQRGQPQVAPRRVATLRDKLIWLAHSGIDQVVIMRFDAVLAQLQADEFVRTVLVEGLQSRYVLVGDDFRYGYQRQGDYAALDAAGERLGFDVARMLSYEIHGLRISSSAVRQALLQGDLAQAKMLLGHPYCISGHVLHGRKLGRELGFRTLKIRLPHRHHAALGIFVSQVHGLTDKPVPAVSSLGFRPAVESEGQLMLETHCLQWPDTLPLDGGYGRCLQIELLHKLHEERHYKSIETLQQGIQADVDAAQAWFIK